jgi:hypothetical protein
MKIVQDMHAVAAAASQQELQQSWQQHQKALDESQQQLLEAQAQLELPTKTVLTSGIGVSSCNSSWTMSRSRMPLLVASLKRGIGRLLLRMLTCKQPFKHCSNSSVRPSGATQI